MDEVASAHGARRSDVAVVTWPDIGRIAAMRPDRVAMSTGRGGGSTRELYRNPLAGSPIAGLLEGPNE